MAVDLTLGEFFAVFGYFFVPILVFGIVCFGGILLSNRMGGKNKLVVMITRIIFIGLALFFLFYYFYWLVGQIFST